MSNQSPTPLHPLGYDPSKPLPYCLTKQDIFGADYKVHHELWDPMDNNYNTTKTLANFLNNECWPLDENNRIPSIDEVTFVRTWLPHFYTGLVNPNESITYAWIENISKHAYNTVDVYRGNQLIYRIPPLVGRSDTLDGNDLTYSLSNLAKDLQTQEGRMGGTPEDKINKMFKYGLLPQGVNDLDANRAKFLVRPNLKYLFVMDEIFTYYGYDSILTPDIMSIKPQVFGVTKDGIKSNGIIPNESDRIVEAYDDDDDLF